MRRGVLGRQRAWRGARRENGYALLVVMLAMSLMVIMLAEAVPSWRTEIQREHEAQMIDRAREYRMAIRRYFHKNGRYPPDLDAMVERDGFGLRYLRQKWPDPLNPSADGAWQFIHYGQAVTKEIVDQPPQQAGSAMGGVASPGLAGGTTAPGMGSSPTAGLGVALASGLSGAGAPGLSNGATAGAGGIAGLPLATPAGDGNAIGGANSGAASAGPIIGVASMSKEPAVHAFNGFDTPDHWQFVYNFATDPSLRAGMPGAGGLPGGTAPGAVGQTPGQNPGMTMGPTPPTPPSTPLGGGSGSTGNPPGGCCSY